jgi:hypothetical protein
MAMQRSSDYDELMVATSPADFPHLINYEKRAAYIVLGISLLITLTGVVIVMNMTSLSGPVGSHGIPFGLELTGLTCVGLGPVLLIVALVYIPITRQTDRDFADFQAGRFLVHWVYQPDEFELYVRSLLVRWRFWARLAGALLVLVAAVFAILFATGPYGWQNRPLCAAVVFAAGIVVSFLLYSLALLAIHSQLNSIRKLGRHAFISKNACYFAGKHTHWNVKKWFMHVLLDDARVTEGTPLLLTFTITTRAGTPRQDATARAALTAVAGAAIAAGLSQRAPAKNGPKIVRIPIPAGHENEAHQIVELLLGSRLRDAPTPDYAPESTNGNTSL